MESREIITTSVPITSVINISRPVFNEAEFDKQYGLKEVDARSLTVRLKKFVQNIKRKPGGHFKKWLVTCVPPAEWLAEYEWKKGLVADLIAGITVGIMNIPQGMAYGLLAGLSPEYGLYTSFFPPLLYALFGTSRHISFGTFAVISLMVSSVIDKYVPSNSLETNSTNSTTEIASNSSSFASMLSFCGSKRCSSCKVQQEALDVAFALTFLVGFFQICFGLLHLGVISVYLSDQLVEGLTTSAAVQVFTSQISKLFGISGLPSTSGVFGVIKFYVCFFANITLTNRATIIMSVICIIVLVVVKDLIEPPFKKKLKVPIPVELLVVIFGTLICYLASLNTRFKVSVVGSIPTGLPPPIVPSFSRMGELIPDAISLSIVIYAISLSMGKLFAKKNNYKIEANQEWFAYGYVHLISSFFSCHCAGASLSRSAIQELQGGRSQIAGIFASLIILVVLLALAPLFQLLPHCALAAIIVVNLRSLFKQVCSLPMLWKRSKIDFFIWVVAFISVLVLDISLGLFFGLAFAILTVLYRAQWPDSVCLGQIPYSELYKGCNAYSGVREIPRVKIYRFESPLYFVNAAKFKEELYKRTNLDPLLRKKELAQNSNKLLVQSLTEANINSINKRLFQIDYDKHCHKSTESDSSNSANTAKDGECTPTMIEESSSDPSELQAIIIDCSSFPYVDLTGVETLKQIYEEYKEIGIQVMFANTKVFVRKLFDSCEFYKSVPKSVMYLSVHDAVTHFLNSRSTSTTTFNSVCHE